MAQKKSIQGAVQENSQEQLLFILWAIGRWSPIAIPLALMLAVGVTVFLWTQYVPEFEAMAWLKIEDRRPKVVFEDRARQDSRSFVSTQIQLMSTPLLLGQVLNDEQIAQYVSTQATKDPLDWLKNRLNVSAVGRSELYHVKFTAPDASIAATAANRVVESFLELHSSQESKESQRVLELLDQEKEHRAKELERLEENVRTLTKQVTGKDPSLVGTGTQVVLSTVSADEQKLATAEVDRQVLEMKLSAFQETLASTPPEVPEELINEALHKNIKLNELRDELSLRRAEFDQIASVAAQGEDSPRVAPIKQKMKALQKTIKDTEQALRKRVRTQVVANLEEQRQERLNQMQAEVAEKKALERLFKRRIETQLADRKDVGGQALELEFAKKALTQAEDVFQKITDRAMALKTEMRAPTRISLLQAAKDPIRPSSQPPWKAIAMGVIASLLGPFALAVGWEALMKRVRQIEQLRKSLDVPVIGEIAALPARRRAADQDNTKFLRRQELYVESIDSLRTNLILAEEMQDVRILSVASAVSSEGKTSLSSQLAVSLARASGEPTLLIDGDMRAPDLHEIFKVPNDIGLSDVLEGKSHVKEAIVTDWHEHLHLLPAGRLKRSPYALLGNGAIDSVFEELRSLYRYIVVDAPPVLSASEALILAKATDGTILCTMKDRTREGQMKLALERLQAAGARTLGAVLAGVPARSYAYKYGGYYYYGSNGGSETSAEVDGSVDDSHQDKDQPTGPQASAVTQQV